MTAKDVKIISIEQLRQNTDEGSTIEIVYDLKSAGMTYKTATNLAIFPKNSEEDIQECISILGYESDQKFAFINNPLSNKKGTIKHPFATPMTVRDAIEYFVDLRGPLMKRTVKDLSDYCNDPNEKRS